MKDKYGVSQGNKGRECGMAAGPAAQITEVGTVHIRGSGYLGLGRECASEGGAWKMTSEGRQESGMER